jgi:hypothetical protein
MVTLPNWISGILKRPREREIIEQTRASQAWRRISMKPLSVVFRTPTGTRLAAQLVRVESDNTATPSESTAGSAPKRKVIIYGVINHPTVPDVDMKEGYIFVYHNDEYRCVDIIQTLGEIQGIWETTG